MNPALILKKLLPRTLFGRALIIIVSPLILLQVITTHIFYDRHWDTITRRLSASIAGDISMVLDQLAVNPSAEQRIFARARSIFGFAISLRPHEILPNQSTGISVNDRIDKFLSHAIREQVRRPFLIDTSSFKEQVIIDIQLADGVLSVTAPGERLFSSTTYIFIMWMVGSSLILFAVASVFMRNQVRPIRRLAQAVDSFGKGREVDGDFRSGGALEVRQAATAFNLMRERIHRQIRQRTDMLSGVSHDLRTPLTRMRLQLAMLGHNPEIDEMKADIDEMETMIEGYLTFARGEGDEVAVETDLPSLVEDVIAGWRRNNAKIDDHVEGKITAWLKPRALQRCLDNLIANACRYGEHVWVRVGKRAEMTEIIIDDDGPGIPESEREKAFRPFYRVDQSRNAETGGTGLGLAIARGVARAHGGDIILEDSPHGGLRARVRLPL
ncbi:MAG: two-component system osmolarity sensor histidine kinase EnvZ [Alphaproteobacteria bacterium]|jgi:two-component system osmolarity sensor histidine kinase EnvZ